ncbi:hypothetical protein Leryth_019254, partial [Lithospermum erythrorhizon]
IAGNHHEACWNEKIKLELSTSESETTPYLNFKIMNEEYFGKHGYVGQTIIYLKGFIMDANENDLIELQPSPYNVVLEDDTYKGKINIGLRFIPNVLIMVYSLSYL